MQRGVHFKNHYFIAIDDEVQEKEKKSRIYSQISTVNMAKVEPRNVGPLLQMLRNFLLGREHTTHLRHQDFIAARTQPPPDLPGGPAHKLAANYYYTRDGRREVKLPTILALQSGQKAISEGTSASKDVAITKPPTPGSVFRWD